MRIFLLIHIIAAILVFDANARIKSVTPKTDELLTVKTALGIATIIQTPLPIQSAIIGDQSGFKVEYLNNAVTIKPLRFGAKTNLYLMTSTARFNLRLITVNQDLADYVFYIKEPLAKGNVIWKIVNKESSKDGISLRINRIGETSQGQILIDANIFSSSPLSLLPGDFFIFQNEKSKVIESLFLSHLSAKAKEPVSIGISISKSDLTTKKPVTLKFRLSKSVSVQIPESALWK